MFTNRDYSKQILFAFGLLKIKNRSITNIRNFSFVQTFVISRAVTIIKKKKD